MFPDLDRRPFAEALAFLRSLARDLEVLGYKLDAIGGKNSLTQTTQCGIDGRAFYYQAHFKLHQQRLRLKRADIEAFESKFADTVFIEGEQLDFSKIDPHLRTVDLRKDSQTPERDRRIMDYIRTFQTVGSSMSVGRENAFILEDRGHPNSPVMGALVLASPRYFQPRRDQMLSWPAPVQLAHVSASTKRRQKKRRLNGLNRIMHVAVCCALPPYNQLGAARLLAAAPFVKLVRDDFATRWYHSDRNPDPDLAMVTTTTSMGNTGTPFQNLRAGKFVGSANTIPRGDKWNQEGKIYGRLSDKHPWLGHRLSASEKFADFRGLVSEETLNIAKALVVASGAISQAPIKDLNRAVALVGLSPSIFEGNPIGFFVGALNRQSIEAVSSGQPRQDRLELDWNLVVEQFRSDFGEADEPTVKRGVDPVQRRVAIQGRRERAARIRKDDILLSRRFGAAAVCLDRDGEETG